MVVDDTAEVVNLAVFDGAHEVIECAEESFAINIETILVVIAVLEMGVSIAYAAGGYKVVERNLCEFFGGFDKRLILIFEIPANIGRKGELIIVAGGDVADIYHQPLDILCACGAILGVVGNRIGKPIGETIAVDILFF